MTETRRVQKQKRPELSNEQDLIELVRGWIEDSSNPLALIEEISDMMFEVHPLKTMPVSRVKWVDIEKVQANDYNPNSVARNEMKLLYTSIAADGYTQPVVTVYDEETDKYTVIDGFHRYTIMRSNEDIREATGGRLPVVVLDIDMNDRMASTVRHNRARGKHAVSGMSNMVFSMLENGWTDKEICDQLGMEPDELLRLKHVTGFSKLFENVEYRKAWESRAQIKIRKAYRDKVARQEEEKEETQRLKVAQTEEDKGEGE